MAFLDGILVFLLARALVALSWTAVAIRRLAGKPRTDECLEGDRRLVLMLPVLDEELVVRDAVRHLVEVTDGLGNIEVWVVGTARERGSRGNPTLEAVTDLAAHNRVRVVEDPRPSGWMAHQLNYVIGELSSSANTERTWLLFVNVDTRMSRVALLSFVHLINRDVDIIQQSALFLANYDSLGFLARGFAIWQSRWTIAHELRRFAMHRRWKFALVHVVGHGLCISLTKLLSYKRLPEDTVTEDLHFGFYLAAHGEDMVSLPVLSLGDSPTSVRAALRQKYVWSFGPMLYPRYLLLLKRKFPAAWREVRVRGIILCAQGVVSFASWLLVSWTLLYLAWLSVAAGSVLAALVLISYLANYAQCIRFFKQEGYVVGSPLSALTAAIAAGLLHSLPAALALFHLTLRTPIRKYKTPHA